MAAGRASNNYHWPAGASGLLLTARPGAQSASCDHYARRSVEWSTKRGRSRGRCLSSQKAANKHAARSLARSANRMCVQERAIINSSASIGAQTFAGPQQLALLLRFFLSVFFSTNSPAAHLAQGSPRAKHSSGQQVRPGANFGSSVTFGAAPEVSRPSDCAIE